MMSNKSKISEGAKSLGRIYGRHSKGYIRHTYNRAVKFGISPAMCEARHNDWSWKGQHRYKGWPWEMTVERITRRLNREREQLWIDAANRYVDMNGDIIMGGMKVGHVTDNKFYLSTIVGEPLGSENINGEAWEQAAEKRDVKRLKAYGKKKKVR